MTRLEGISTGVLAQTIGRFYRGLGKKLSLGASIVAIQVRSFIPRYLQAVPKRFGRGFVVLYVRVSCDKHVDDFRAVPVGILVL